jgi:UDP-perosamine 4-acetyltransferase
LLAVLDRPVLGCVAPTAPAAGWPETCPWLGNDTVLDSFDPAAVALVNGLGSVGATTLRRRVFDAARKRGFFFPTLVHPSAILASDVTLADGVQVMAGAILQAGTTVADNALLNTGCIVDHDCHIGAHTHLGPGVTLSGSVHINIGVHIGTAATVIQGVTIGADAVVGAGSVVVHDVASFTQVVGVPAKIHNSAER